MDSIINTFKKKELKLYGLIILGIRMSCTIQMTLLIIRKEGDLTTNP
jgi:hypothetical protein